MLPADEMLEITRTVNPVSGEMPAEELAAVAAAEAAAAEAAKEAEELARQKKIERLEKDKQRAQMVIAITVGLCH